jgi:biopolymer transport protein ExbB
MDIFAKGGIVLVMIVILSIIAFAIIIERFYKIVRFENKKNADKVRSLIRSGDIATAFEYATKNRSCLSLSLAIVLNNTHITIEALKEKVNKLIINTNDELENNLWFVRVAMNLAPLLGLLGTVTGMIKVFSYLSLNSVDPSDFALGISEALITTAAGLLVLVPLTILYGYLERKIEKILVDLETAALEAISIVKGSL